MSNRDVYKTVKGRGEALIIEKKSKFIASVCPAAGEAAALDFLNEIRSKYPDATHNVYAYVIDENNIFRYSDDGEPSGTAGMPTLDAIRKQGIVDAAVVVTRYFGGTLLGTGGLVHAYGASAAAGLKAAGIVVRRKCDILSVKIDYTLLGKVKHEAERLGLDVSDITYSDAVTINIPCPIERTTGVMRAVEDMTNARAVCDIIDKKYIDSEAMDE